MKKLGYNYQKIIIKFSSRQFPFKAREKIYRLDINAAPVSFFLARNLLEV